MRLPSSCPSLRMILFLCIQNPLRLVIRDDKSLLSLTAALVISAPTSAFDYRSVASLLVSTFDAPDGKTLIENNSIEKTFEFIHWNFYEKVLTEEFTYKQYVNTARRMLGKKYCMFVAKENIPQNVTKGRLKQRAEVVGMAEMGMSICPFHSHDVVDESVIPAHGTDDNDTSHDNSVRMIPQPKVGVLCVKSTHQHTGIGLALLQKCEQVARDTWNEKYLFADVEPDNYPALSFFEKCGYYCSEDENKIKQVRYTTVMKQRVAEVRPHLLLKKNLMNS